MYLDYRSIGLLGLLCGASVHALPAAIQNEAPELAPRQGTSESPNSNDGEALWFWACADSNWTNCGKAYGPGMAVGQCYSWGSYWGNMGNGAFRTNMECWFFDRLNCAGVRSQLVTNWVSNYDYWYANTQSFQCFSGNA